MKAPLPRRPGVALASVDFLMNMKRRGRGELEEEEGTQSILDPFLLLTWP